MNSYPKLSPGVFIWNGMVVSAAALNSAILLSEFTNNHRTIPTVSRVPSIRKSTYSNLLSHR